MITLQIIYVQMQIIIAAKGEDILKNFKGSFTSSVKNDEFPYVVALRGRWLCDGSILDERTIVTSARCFINNISAAAEDPELYVINSLYVFGGDIDLKGPGVMRKIARLVIHPYFNSNLNSKNSMNDVALAILREDFEWRKTLRSIPLSNALLSVDTKCQVAGWGKDIYNNTKLPHELLNASDVHVYDFEKCTADVTPKNVTPNENYQFCALPKKGFRNHLDTGSPLVCNGKLAGLMSKVIECKGCELPVIFTNLSTFYSWIKMHQENHITTSPPPSPRTLSLAQSFTNVNIGFSLTLLFLLKIFTVTL